MPKIPIVFALCLFGTFLRSQSAEPPIQTDRPDQTECPFTVPSGHVQIEAGGLSETITGGNTNLLCPTILWKYGINDKVEFRLITERTAIKTTTGNNRGLNPITLGFKTTLLEENGIVPKTAIIGHLTTSKLGSESLRTTYVAPSFRFLLQHSLSDNWSLSYNLGAEWDGETGEHTFLYTLSTAFALTNRTGCFIEVYGFKPADSLADHRFDTGVTFLINNNLQADISAGVGLTENAPDYFLSLGLSYRFRAK